MKCVNEITKWVQVKLVSPSLMPKLGKAGSLQSRQAIVHSLAHTESWAVDLSWVFLFSFLSTFSVMFMLRIYTAIDLVDHFMISVLAFMSVKPKCHF